MQVTKEKKHIKIYHNLLTQFIFMSFLLSPADVYAQASVNHAFHNNFVFGLDGAITFPQTDYLNNKIGFGFRINGEYYFKTNSIHLIGLKLKLGSEQIKGEDDRGILSTQDGTREIPPSFTTDIYNLGIEAIYSLSIGDVFFPYLSGGVSNLWFFPEDDQGKPAAGGNAQLYEKTSIAYSVEIGFKYLVSERLSINLSFNQILPQTDYLDDVAAAFANDSYSSVVLGFSFAPFFDSDDDIILLEANGLGADEPPDQDGTEIEEFYMEYDETYGEQKFIILADDIFDLSSAMIKAEGKEELDRVLKQLQKFPDKKWRIEGHMDSYGSEGFLRSLSYDRAKAVQEYFIYFGGLEKDNFVVIGLGDNFPVADNETEEGRIQNRRIEVTPEVIEEPLVEIEDSLDVSIEPSEEFDQFILRSDDSFEKNTSDLTILGKLLLDEIASYIKNKPASKWRIESYTDNQGTASIQKRITNDRAYAVYDYLILKGLSADQFTVSGLGSSNPITTNDTEEGRSTNRRVLIILER